jgi:hypothetical protein
MSKGTKQFQAGGLRMCDMLCCRPNDLGAIRMYDIATSPLLSIGGVPAGVIACHVN